MIKKRSKLIWISLLIILFIIQLFPIDKNNPPVVEEQDFYTLNSPPADVSQLLKQSCNDCHSNETQYPGYTRFQPVGWWIKGHIKGGLQHLNFSEWGNLNRRQQSHKLDECIEVLEQKRMPLKSYTWLHSEAALDDEARDRLKAYFESLRQI